MSKVFFTIFFTVFFAEIGDKTQLATMLFSADAKVSKLVVFSASASALLLATLIGVMAGDVLAKYVSEQTVSTVAGLCFVSVGAWMLAKTYLF